MHSLECCHYVNDVPVGIGAFVILLNQISYLSLEHCPFVVFVNFIGECCAD